MELLFTPGINQDIHAVFLEQIAQSDPDALHVVIMDQAGFHLRPHDGRLPAKVRVLSLPPYCPEINPAEWFGRLVKAPTINRIYQGLRQLEDHLSATARRWSHPDKVGSLVHSWMRDQLSLERALRVYG